MMDGGDWYVCFKSLKNLYSAMCYILMNQWKVTLVWCYMVIALKLHNSCSYIVVIELQKLHMYTISSMMNYIYCNSCDLFDNIHAHKNTSSCNELQMVIAT
jgi:hypothetical protein